MDTSLKYIKMCKKAVEIQEAHVPMAWDYYYGGKYDYGVWHQDDPTILVASDYCTDSGLYGLGMEEYEREGYTLICWLPRQDQLQEIAGYRMGNVAELYNLDTYEQAWLDFVMRLKYNKKWNDEKEDWL